MDDATQLATEVVENLQNLASLVREHVGIALGEANLNETRFVVLRNIAARGDTGCSQIELASVLRQAESSVCTLIDRMKADGLVYRFRSKTDRRKSFLMLTEEGQSALSTALESYETMAREIARSWNQKRTTQFRSLLEELLFELERPEEVDHNLALPKRRAA